MHISIYLQTWMCENTSKKKITRYAYATLLLLAMVMASQIYKCRYINGTRLLFYYYVTWNYTFILSFKFFRQSI